MLEAMLKKIAFALMISSYLSVIARAENELSGCDCEDVGFWSTENLLECQKVSDFLIALAYFSIPIELLYFLSCSNVPFKWVLLEFVAFIVLCGMSHLLNGWSYGPHSFELMLSLTIVKVLTVLVSLATAITLITLIPLLLKVKVREFMLMKKTWDLGRKVGMIKKQTEIGVHVRMLTQEIRRSLDRHTILYTTMVELSKTLNLQNCAIWMPNENKKEMKLIHELRVRNASDTCDITVPASDRDVLEIKETNRVKVLSNDSALAAASNGNINGEPGSAAVIRMPMLRASNFKGGTPEMAPASYSILVLVLPGKLGRSWNAEELEIVEVVADQVAVALSHAAVLEESQYMRERLVEQNRALQQAKQDALLANQARSVFQMIMSNGLRRLMHSILGLLSMMQEDNLKLDQQLIVESMVKTSSVLSTLINDVTDTSSKDSGKFSIEMKSFQLHSMIKEAVCIAKCLCVYSGYQFSVEVDRSLPDHVMADEKRVFQIILHLIGSLLSCGRGSGCLVLQVLSANVNQRSTDQRWDPWKSDLSDGHVYVRFEVAIANDATQSNLRRRNSVDVEALSFGICRQLARLMQGDIWVVPNPQGFDLSMSLVLRFQKRPSIVVNLSDHAESSHHSHHRSLLRGLKVLLAEDDNLNRAVCRRILERLGCAVSAVSSGLACLSALVQVASFQLVLVDLHLPDLDGLEVVAKIRKRGSRNRPLIVGLTSSNEDDVWEHCFQVGMNGLIRKPVLLHEIQDELQRVIQANRVVP